MWVDVEGDSRTVRAVQDLGTRLIMSFVDGAPITLDRALIKMALVYPASPSCGYAVVFEFEDTRLDFYIEEP